MVHLHIGLETFLVFKHIHASGKIKFLRLRITDQLVDRIRFIIYRLHWFQLFFPSGIARSRTYLLCPRAPQFPDVFFFPLPEAPDALLFSLCVVPFVSSCTPAYITSWSAFSSTMIYEAIFAGSRFPDAIFCWKHSSIGWRSRSHTGLITRASALRRWRWQRSGACTQWDRQYLLPSLGWHQNSVRLNSGHGILGKIL